MFSVVVLLSVLMNHGMLGCVQQEVSGPSHIVPKVNVIIHFNVTASHLTTVAIIKEKRNLDINITIVETIKFESPLR